MTLRREGSPGKYHRYLVSRGVRLRVYAIHLSTHPDAREIRSERQLCAVSANRTGAFVFGGEIGR